MIIGPELDPANLEVNSFNTKCPECGFNNEVAPRVETEPDGTMLLWTDRSVIEEYQGEEVHQILLENRRSGARLAVTQGSSDYEFWAICDDCSTPFPSAGAYAFTVALAEDDGPPDSKVASCPSCGGLGSALLSRHIAGETVTYANSPGFAETVAETIADQVAAGEIDLATAIKKMRGSSDPRIRRVAAWLEERPVSTLIAISVIQVTVALFGPGLVADDDEKAQLPVSGYTDEQVDRIINSILEHYDEQLLRGPSDSSTTPNVITEMPEAEGP